MPASVWVQLVACLNIKEWRWWWWWWCGVIFHSVYILFAKDLWCILLEIIALYNEGVGDKSRILEATSCTDVCGGITKNCLKKKEKKITTELHWNKLVCGRTGLLLTLVLSEFYSSRDWKHWSLDLSALWGHFHDVKTVQRGGWGQISVSTAQRRTGDLLTAERWNVKCYFWSGGEAVFCHLWGTDVILCSRLLIKRCGTDLSVCRLSLCVFVHFTGC